MEEKYFGQDAKSMARRVYDAVLYYIETGLCLDGEALLQVNRKEHTVTMVEGGEALPNCDYYAMRDFIKVDEEGIVEPSDDVIANLVASYAVA